MRVVFFCYRCLRLSSFELLYTLLGGLICSSASYVCSGTLLWEVCISRKSLFSWAQKKTDFFYFFIFLANPRGILGSRRLILEFIMFKTTVFIDPLCSLDRGGIKICNHINVCWICAQMTRSRLQLQPRSTQRLSQEHQQNQPLILCSWISCRSWTHPGLTICFKC